MIKIKIKKCELVSTEDYLDLLRFVDSVQTLILNDKQGLAIDMLEHKKKVLQEKVKEAYGEVPLL